MRTSPTSFAVLVFALTVIVSPCAFAADQAAGPYRVGAATSKAKKQKRVAGEEIFDNKTVLPLRIEISPSEMVFLRRGDDRKDVRATVTEGTNVWLDVGLHVKGAAGSRRPIDDKPALTLNFGKFTPKQRFHGLRKIHLNNSVQDGSYLTENICGELYRKAGVPAARVSYATLVLNGKARGLYVLKEGLTKDMLGLYFKNPDGNLYDGGFLREITDQLERDVDGDEDVRDWSDLKALAKAAQQPDPLTRFDALSRVLDMDRFLSFAALQIMTWDWDGYVMNRNNYRVYHDIETGKMVFLPHGMDQMFWETSHFIVPKPNRFNGLAANAVMTTPEGKRLYRERFGQVFTNVFQIEMLTNRVNELAALLRPHVENTNEYNGQVKRIRDLITAQHANFTKRLAEPEPKPLAFTGGIAMVTNWAIPSPEPRDPAKALRDRVDVDGRHALHIITTNHTTNTTASWRATVYLTAGKYRFEAMGKSAGIVPALDVKKGEGAGIRQHGTQTNRLNKLVGDAPWQKLEFEMPIQFEQEVTLVCELRATAGEVWFDVDSMKLVKTE